MSKARQRLWCFFNKLLYFSKFMPPPFSRLVVTDQTTKKETLVDFIWVLNRGDSRPRVLQGHQYIKKIKNINLFAI